jgi:hypothetical protein
LWWLVILSAAKDLSHDVLRGPFGVRRCGGAGHYWLRSFVAEGAPQDDGNGG